MAVLREPYVAGRDIKRVKIRESALTGIAFQSKAHAILPVQFRIELGQQRHRQTARLLLLPFQLPSAPHQQLAGHIQPPVFHHLTGKECHKRPQDSHLLRIETIHQRQLCLRGDCPIFRPVFQQTGHHERGHQRKCLQRLPVRHIEIQRPDHETCQVFRQLLRVSSAGLALLLNQTHYGIRQLLSLHRHTAQQKSRSEKGGSVNYRLPFKSPPHTRLI